VLGAASWLLVNPSQQLTVLPADSASEPDQKVKRLSDETAKA
jgi:hypothetical protein